MNQKTNPHLEQASNIQLPACEFCRTIPCWNCAYYESWAPDSDGKCRCSYEAYWYPRHHGCTNGITPEEYRKKKQEEDDRKHTSTSSSFNKELRGFIIVIAVATVVFLVLFLLFSMGIMKTKTTFQLLDCDPAGYELHLVYMDDFNIVVTEEFSEYKVLQDTFNEEGLSEFSLLMGEYDLWLTYDGLSMYTGHFSNIDPMDGLFGTSATYRDPSMEKMGYLVAHLTVRGSDKKPATQPLTVTDENGQTLSCTRLGEDGSYILFLDNTDTRVFTVTVSMEGCKSQTLELDFTDSRVVHDSIKFKKN